MWVWLFFFFRSGASTGGASEKGCRREGEQAGGDTEVHNQEHKREEAAAGGAGGVSTGAESSGGCKRESLLTNHLLVNTRGNVDLLLNIHLCIQRVGGHVLPLQAETPVTPLTSSVPGKKNLPRKTGRKRKNCQLEVCVCSVCAALLACKTSI